jgi:hypothetical protein
VPCAYTRPAQIKFISVGNMYDLRFNFLQVSGAVTLARVSLKDTWVNLIKTETNGYTLDASDKSGLSNQILTQDSFTLQLWNARGEKIEQGGLTPQSFQQGGGLFTGEPGFQFKST